MIPEKRKPLPGFAHPRFLRMRGQPQRGQPLLHAPNSPPQGPAGGGHDQDVIPIPHIADALFRHLVIHGGQHANASYQFQRSVESGESVIVGVNKFAQQHEEKIELLQIDSSSQRHQVEKLARLRARRDGAKVTAALAGLRRAAAGTENTMPHLLEAVRAYATLGEICDALREVWGSYTEFSIV